MSRVRGTTPAASGSLEPLRGRGSGKEAPVSARRRPGTALLLGGPGMVFMLAAVGPQDLISNAAIGASHAYSLLWTLIPIAVARYVVLEASGRYVAVTGESLLQGYARYGRWVAWLLLLSIAAKRHLTNLSHILLTGAIVQLILPLPWRRGEALWALVFWMLGVGVMWWGRYDSVERWFRPLGVLLGGSLAATALMARPDAVLLLKGLTTPWLAPGDSFRGTLFLLMALLGAGAGSVSNLKYPAFLLEKGWTSRDYLRANRREALVSASGLFITALLVQVAAASASGSTSRGIGTVGDLTGLFAEVLGETGRLTVAVGLWAAIFTTFVGANTGYSLIASDLYHNVLRRQRAGAGGAAPGERPAYRWALLLFTATPLYGLLTAWQPVWLVLLSAAFLVVLLPLVVVVLLLLASSRERMGEHRTGWAPNLVMALVIAASLYLTWQGAAELLR